MALLDLLSILYLNFKFFSTIPPFARDGYSMTFCFFVKKNKHGITAIRALYPFRHSSILFFTYARISAFRLASLIRLSIVVCGSSRE